VLTVSICALVHDDWGGRDEPMLDPLLHALRDVAHTIGPSGL
jgi:hypothetical protein